MLFINYNQQESPDEGNPQRLLCSLRVYDEVEGHLIGRDLEFIGLESMQT